MNKTSAVCALADHRSPFSCISGERRHNLPQNKIWTEIERRAPTHRTVARHRERGRSGRRTQQERRGMMLKPQEPPPPPPPPVFGKPWYWQRSSGSMESSRSLAHVVMEMRDEIKKLEAENRELRGDAGGPAPGPAAAAAAAVENPYVNLRRNVSAPLLEAQYKENAVMTVRRYSVSSNLSGVVLREGRGAEGPRTAGRDSGWGRLQEEIRHRSIMAENTAGAGSKGANRHSLQEYVHKNRAKVKTVTFLLPVDDIYTSRPVLARRPDDCKAHGGSQLAAISETDS